MSHRLGPDCVYVFRRYAPRLDKEEFLLELVAVFDPIFIDKAVALTTANLYAGYFMYADKELMREKGIIEV